MRKKAKVNQCCTYACSDPICQKVGCLNQDGFTLRPRLNLLLLRLESFRGDTSTLDTPNNKPNNLKIRIEPVPKKPTIDGVSQKPKTSTATGKLVITSEEPKNPLEQKLAETKEAVKSNIVDISKYRKKDGL